MSTFKKFIKTVFTSYNLEEDVSRALTNLQTNIEGSIVPIVAKTQNDSNIITSVQLKPGSNVVNHGLNQNLRGWKITRMRNAHANIYDTQDSNTNPNQTLLLISDISIVVDLEVY